MNSPGLTAPHVRCALVTPADGSDLPFLTRGLSIAGAGAVRVTTAAGDTVTIPSGALAAGVVHPLRVSRVWSTGTTATGIVAFA